MTIVSYQLLSILKFTESLNKFIRSLFPAVMLSACTYLFTPNVKRSLAKCHVADIGYGRAGLFPQM